MHKDDNGRLCWDEDEVDLKRHFNDAQHGARGVEVFVACLFRELAVATESAREAWRLVKRRAEKQGLIGPGEEIRHHWADENFEVFAPWGTRGEKPPEMSAEDPGA